MTTEILMAASGVITLSACYVGWYYAQRAESTKQYADKMCDYANKAWHEITDLKRELDRQADIIARYQAKTPERAPDGKFSSKRERVTAELAAYVAERKAA